MPKSKPQSPSHIPDKSPYVQDESKIIVKESLALRWIAVSDIPQLLWEKNPKLHSLSELWDSICKFGFIDPPKFDKNIRNRAGGVGGIQYGNGRSEAVHWGYMAYKSGDYTGDVPRGIGVNSEGEWFIPVKVGVDAASEAMAADFGVFHNTSTMLGGDFADGDIWRLFEPKELLEIGKMILSDKEFEPLAMNADEVDSLLNFLNGGKTPPDAPEAQIDKAEELNKVWGVKTGDLWLIPSKTGKGVHRLLCGDSTKAEDVNRLFNGELCQLVLTDPPYNVGYADKNAMLNAVSPANRIQHPIEGDHLSKSDSQELWRCAFEQMNRVMSKGAVVYCFMPQGGDQMMMMMMMMMGAGIEPRHELIWLKNNHVLGRVDYAYKHEPILYAWKEGGHKFYGDFQTSIIEVDKPLKNDLHPTMKPVELLSILINNSSQESETVYDMFGGSGSTMVSCEQNSRQCRMMEISEGYCAVILERMKGMDLEPFLSSK